MTPRGCAYAGSKGVVWGPVKDVVHISHGPVGCGQYSWGTRRNYFNGTLGIDSFVAMQFTTDFAERDIVFGGDKKLAQTCEEIAELFPLAKGISVQSECPIGLIGDDIDAVARSSSQELGRPVVPVKCEGFRGVSQSLGHHIANDAIRDWVLGTGELADRDAVRRRPDRRLQHRWRRLGLAQDPGGHGSAGHRPVVRRRHHQRAGHVRTRRSSTSSTATAR